MGKAYFPVCQKIPRITTYNQLGCCNYDSIRCSFPWIGSTASSADVMDQSTHRYPRISSIDFGVAKIKLNKTTLFEKR